MVIMSHMKPWKLYYFENFAYEPDPLIFNPSYPWCVQHKLNQSRSYLMYAYLPSAESFHTYWNYAEIKFALEVEKIRFMDQFQKPAWFQATLTSEVLNDFHLANVKNEIHEELRSVWGIFVKMNSFGVSNELKAGMLKEIEFLLWNVKNKISHYPELTNDQHIKFGLQQGISRHEEKLQKLRKKMNAPSYLDQINKVLRLLNNIKNLLSI